MDKHTKEIQKLTTQCTLSVLKIMQQGYKDAADMIETNPQKASEIAQKNIDDSYKVVEGHCFDLPHAILAEFSASEIMHTIRKPLMTGIMMAMMHNDVEKYFEHAINKAEELVKELE